MCPLCQVKLKKVQDQSRSLQGCIALLNDGEADADPDALEADIRSRREGIAILRGEHEWDKREHGCL